MWFYCKPAFLSFRRHMPVKQRSKMYWNNQNINFIGKKTGYSHITPWQKLPQRLSFSLIPKVFSWTKSIIGIKTCDIIDTTVLTWIPQLFWFSLVALKVFLHFGVVFPLLFTIYKFGSPELSLIGCTATPLPKYIFLIAKRIF